MDADTAEIRDILRWQEPVIARMDERLKTTETRRAAIDVNVARLEGRFSQLPNTVQMLGLVLAVLLAGGLLKFFFG